MNAHGIGSVFVGRGRRRVTLSFKAARAAALLKGARKGTSHPAERAAIEQTLLDLMNTVNTQLDPHEQLGFVVVAQGPWTVGNGFVTPTLKIKRNVLESRYQPCVDDWMRQNRAVVWESPAEGANSAA